ncbi:hypothetical protein ACTXT7_017229 [Hymenolepis weldensis]
MLPETAGDLTKEVASKLDVLGYDRDTLSVSGVQSSTKSASAGSSSGTTACSLKLIEVEGSLRDLPSISPSIDPLTSR